MLSHNKEKALVDVSYKKYKEEKKIQEFVIVIDTSMSCSGELVKTFLEQTYEVLSETESFFRKVNIRILQCDEKGQSDVKVTSREELEQYMKHFQVIGNGGTDFRPAFSYVRELVEKKEYIKKYLILNSKGSRKNPRAFLLGLRKLRYAYLPGKKGHTMGITTKETMKQTMIKPVPAFT